MDGSKAETENVLSVAQHVRACTCQSIGRAQHIRGLKHFCACCSPVDLLFLLKVCETLPQTLKASRLPRRAQETQGLGFQAFLDALQRAGREEVGA